LSFDVKNELFNDQGGKEPKEKHLHKKMESDIQVFSQQNYTRRLDFELAEKIFPFFPLLQQNYY
jgi:hypothetical protein